MCEMTDERPAVSCNAAQRPYLVPLVEMLSSGTESVGPVESYSLSSYLNVS